jgi:uncharacterized protein YndB with AHSA1/START domain/uncharacterized protein YciI
MTLSTDSAAQPTPSDESGAQPVPPLRREVLVAASPETAFALFTAHIDRWWPMARHSVFGGAAIVAFEGDRVVERLGDESSVWAEVTAWDPPRSLTLSWHPGRDDSRATDVSVTFEGVDDGTLVRLVHSGWERTEDPAAAAADYAQGWQGVLAGYAASLAGATPDTETGTWYALVHTPGPALADGESIFAHPAFAEHFAFLGRLQEQGLLVAAGPVDPDNGEGMAIVRVLPEHGDVDIEHLANTDDLCVAGGFLQVAVRPWSVRLVG